MQGAGSIRRSSIRERPRRHVTTFAVVADPPDPPDPADPAGKGTLAEARAIVATYHQEQLRALLEHVREGIARLHAGEIDEFEVDDLIHRYKRATKQLWLFCGSTGSSQELRAVAAALAQWRDRGEERDWWAESARRGDLP